jgi:glucosamine--fructose-6-phosphate aminotransferase (isomerizing)
MCGIFGCALKTGKAAPIIHSTLKLLEYRGYDSVGIATVSNGKLFVKKDAGKIDAVHEKLNLNDLPGKIGIGHTRWATHGAPLKVNAHPHIDCDGRLAIIHNGIIENFDVLRKELVERGHRFVSKTDTEVIAHLIEDNMKNGLKLIDAFKAALKRVEGSYAILCIEAKSGGKILCARKESPLVLGVSRIGIFASSDIPALLPQTRRIVEIKNGEIVTLTPTSFEIHKLSDGTPVKRETHTVDWKVDEARKGGYPHYMLKEIHEQPHSIGEALRVQAKYLDLIASFLDRSKEIYLLASGTSYHACLAASYVLGRLARISAHPIYASEFIEQHGESVNIDSTVLAVSQSGETADVLNAVDHARFRAATVLGLTNIIGSTLTRVSRAYLPQNSGPEIGVAATKTFTAQFTVLAMLALRLAKLRGKISQDSIDDLQDRLEELPKLVEKILQTQEKKVQQLAKKYKDRQAFYFLGRGVSSATAMEGRLKLLELAYIPCLAYPAGESKHGPISVIEPEFPVIFPCPQDSTHKATVGNIMEMKARGARVIAIIEEDDKKVKSLVDDVIELPPNIPEILSPIPYIIPLQLFAYYMALELGLDPDKPRNLAKSVTVL